MCQSCINQFFYACTYLNVARGIMDLSCSSVLLSVCASQNTVNTMQSSIKFCTVQGHGGITYAGTITVQAEAYNTRRQVSS